jgi:hypothetical protein
MSSSDSERDTKVQKKGKDSKDTKLDSYSIKPAKGGASLDTSTWPLLLKVN